MKNIKFRLQWLKLTFTISLVIIPSPHIKAIENTPSWFSLTQNPPTDQNQNSKPKDTFVTPPSRQSTPKETVSAGSRVFKPPSRQGTPKGTVPAGSRGCPQAARNPLTALVPVTKYPDETELRWGLTTQDHPTFWFYVPYQTQSIRAAKFLLRDRANRTIYQTSVTLTKTPGIVSFSLPATAPPLKNNQWYRLSLLIDVSCITNPDSQEVAQAWVKRETLTPVLLSQLDKATTLQKAILYAQNGIWFEALTTTAQLHRSNSQDTQWYILLQSAGLETFADEPIR